MCLKEDGGGSSILKTNIFELRFKMAQILSQKKPIRLDIISTVRSVADSNDIACHNDSLETLTYV